MKRRGKKDLYRKKRRTQRRYKGYLFGFNARSPGKTTLMFSQLRDAEDVPSYSLWKDNVGAVTGATLTLDKIMEAVRTIEARAERWRRESVDFWSRSFEIPQYEPAPAPPELRSGSALALWDYMERKKIKVWWP